MRGVHRIVCWMLRLAFHVHISMCVSTSRKVVLVHCLSPFPWMHFCLWVLYPRGNAARWVTLLCACCPCQCNTHGHDLELVKTVKMPSNDQVNSVILKMRFGMDGNTCFLLRKRASRNVYMESRPYPAVTKVQPILAPFATPLCPPVHAPPTCLLPIKTRYCQLLPVPITIATSLYSGALSSISQMDGACHCHLFVGRLIPPSPACRSGVSTLDKLQTTFVSPLTVAGCFCQAFAPSSSP